MGSPQGRGATSSADQAVGQDSMDRQRQAVPTCILTRPSLKTNVGLSQKYLLHWGIGWAGEEGGFNTVAQAGLQLNCNRPASASQV